MSESIMSDSVLQRLAATIKERRAASPDESYTRRLIDAGPKKPAQKLGEEAVETAIAAVSEDDAALTAEAADLLYHLLVVLECRGVAIEDVLKALEARMGVSGLEEKRRRNGH